MINSPPPAEEAPRKSATDRIQAFFEVLLMSGVISTMLASLPLLFFKFGSTEEILKDSRMIAASVLLETGFTFLILAVIMLLHREPLSTLGVHAHRWKSQTILGLAIVPLLFIINVFVAGIFKTYFPEYYLEDNPLSQSIRTPGQLILFIFTVLVAGAIKEELQRAFILNRFRDYLGGAATGLIVWSLAFGAGHYVQGLQGVVITTLLGCLFGIVYLRTGSLIAPMVAHGCYNTMALLLYWFVSQHIKR